MILAVFNDPHGKRQCNIYYDVRDLNKDLWSPACEVIFMLGLDKVKGKTYREKRETVRELAKEYSNNRGEIYPITYGETSVIQNWFRKYGKRYGLLKEFAEECIC